VPSRAGQLACKIIWRMFVFRANPAKKQ